jgi:SHS2 domain-containing protein
MRPVERGIPICIGSDSNVRIDPLEELRELDGIGRRRSRRERSRPPTSRHRRTEQRGGAWIETWPDVAVNLEHHRFAVSRLATYQAHSFGCSADALVTTEWEAHRGEATARRRRYAEQVVGEAVAAFSQLVARDTGGEAATRDIAVEADDRAGLLVELFGELIYLAETEGFVADSAQIEMGERNLRATLAGRLTSVDPLVKAATYHELRFEQAGGSWNARIVLDV